MKYILSSTNGEKVTGHKTNYNITKSLLHCYSLKVYFSSISEPGKSFYVLITNCFYDYMVTSKMLLFSISDKTLLVKKKMSKTFAYRI